MRTQQYCAAAIVAALMATQLAGCGGGADANCGGSVQPAPTPTVPGPAPAPAPSAKVASVSLVFSSSELASAGAVGSEVTVTALVKTAENTAVAGARVEFSADSGLLAAAAAVTDQSGNASATLGTGGSKLNRPIQVGAKAGNQSSSGVVSVSGTRLTFSCPAFLSLGSTADLVATLVDSADRPIAGATVVASTALGNGAQSGARPSDSRGQVAVVRDGTAANNLVKGATVQFSILADPSGGNLVSPFTSVTGSDGIARAVFVAGLADGAWVKVELTVSGTVAGTESLARSAFWLQPLAKDLIAKAVSPPGRISPYGTQSCASAD